jgi:hypothetical protein
MPRPTTHQATDLHPLIEAFAAPEVTAEEWAAIRAALAPLVDPEHEPVALPSPASCEASGALQRLCWHLQRCAVSASLPLGFYVRAMTRDVGAAVMARHRR